MRKLLKADLYRLFRTRALYICILIMTAIMVSQLFLLKWAESLLEGEVLLNPNGISYGIEWLTAGNAPLFMAIFIAIFVTAEFTFGTMKNIVSKGFSKVHIYLSKLITVSVASVIMIISIVLFSIIAGTIATGELGEISLDYGLELLRLLGIQLLLYIALASVFLFVAMTVRNNGGVIAINIIGIIMFSALIYELLGLLFKNKYDFNKYSLQQNILHYYMNVSPPIKEMIRSVVVGCAFLIIPAIVGILIFKKADVK